MKYDDASWHYGGDFPADLSLEAGATHIAMFVVWCWLNDMGGDLIRAEFPEVLQTARDRSKSPAALFIQASDEKFTDEDLNAEGNAFAQSYYGSEGNYITSKEGYVTDYGKVFPSVASLYHAPDTWEAYDRLAPVIHRRYSAWKNRPQSWLSKFWPRKN